MCEMLIGLMAPITFGVLVLCNLVPDGKNLSAPIRVALRTRILRLRKEGPTASAGSAYPR